MFTEISAFFGQIFTAVLGWLDDLFGAMDATGYVLAAAAVFFAVQLLLIPLRGSGSSDKAKKKEDDV